MADPTSQEIQPCSEDPGHALSLERPLRYFRKQDAAAPSALKLRPLALAGLACHRAAAIDTTNISTELSALQAAKREAELQRDLERKRRRASIEALRLTRKLEVDARKNLLRSLEVNLRPLPPAAPSHGATLKTMERIQRFERALDAFTHRTLHWGAVGLVERGAHFLREEGHTRHVLLTLCILPPVVVLLCLLLPTTEHPFEFAERESDARLFLPYYVPFFVFPYLVTLALFCLELVKPVVLFTQVELWLIGLACVALQLTTLLGGISVQAIGRECTTLIVLANAMKMPGLLGMVAAFFFVVVRQARKLEEFTSVLMIQTHYRRLRAVRHSLGLIQQLQRQARARDRERELRGRLAHEKADLTPNGSSSLEHDEAERKFPRLLRRARLHTSPLFAGCYHPGQSRPSRGRQQTEDDIAAAIFSSSRRVRRDRKNNGSSSLLGLGRRAFSVLVFGRGYLHQSSLLSMRDAYIMLKTRALFWVLALFFLIWCTIWFQQIFVSIWATYNKREFTHFPWGYTKLALSLAFNGGFFILDFAASAIAAKCDSYLVTLHGGSSTAFAHGGFMVRDRVRIAYSAYVHSLTYSLFAQLSTWEDFAMVRAPTFFFRAVFYPIRISNTIIHILNGDVERDRNILAVVARPVVRVLTLCGCCGGAVPSRSTATIVPADDSFVMEEVDGELVTKEQTQKARLVVLVDRFFSSVVCISTALAFAGSYPWCRNGWNSPLFAYYASEASEAESRVLALTLISVALESMVLVVLNTYAKFRYNISVFGVGKHACLNDPMLVISGVATIVHVCLDPLFAFSTGAFIDRNITSCIEDTGSSISLDSS